MEKHTDQFTRLDSTSPPPTRANSKSISCVWHTFFFFFPLLCSVSEITCVVSLAKLLTGFSMCYLFCVLHCKGAFLASFFTEEKFILGTVTCRWAGAGMSWLRWNDENRVYKITTELPVHKPLSTCQNRSEKCQYFCNVSESSSGVFWGLVFLQFLSFFWATGTWQGKERIPLFPDCWAQGRFAAGAPHLSVSAGMGSGPALKFAVSYYCPRDGSLAWGNPIQPVVAGGLGPRVLVPVFPIYNHQDRPDAVTAGRAA